jgi:hypothetical protein
MEPSQALKDVIALQLPTVIRDPDIVQRRRTMNFFLKPVDKLYLDVVEMKRYHALRNITKGRPPPPGEAKAVLDRIKKKRKEHGSVYINDFWSTMHYHDILDISEMRSALDKIKSASAYDTKMRKFNVMMEGLKKIQATNLANLNMLRYEAISKEIKRLESSPLLPKNKTMSVIPPTDSSHRAETPVASPKNQRKSVKETLKVATRFYQELSSHAPSESISPDVTHMQGFYSNDPLEIKLRVPETTTRGSTLRSGERLLKVQSCVKFDIPNDPGGQTATSSFFGKQNASLENQEFIASSCEALNRVIRKCDGVLCDIPATRQY